MKPTDRFTYKRTTVKTDDGSEESRIEFLLDRAPFFKKPVPCSPDQALGLVRKLNAIHPKKLSPKAVEPILNGFFKRIETAQASV